MPKRSYVREDKEQTERLDFEEEVVRKCLGYVRSEYTRLQAEWLVLLDLFEKVSAMEATSQEEASKKGHEKLERMHKTLQGMKKSRRRPMKVVEVDDMTALKSLMESQIGRLKKEEIPGPSSHPDQDLIRLIGEVDDDAEMINVLGEVDDETMFILNGVEENKCKSELAEEHAASVSDLETNDFDCMSNSFFIDSD